MNISVIGAGQMGNGIAHVFAQAGHSVTLIDIAQDRLDKALATIGRNLDRQVTKGTLTEDEKKSALGNITTATDMATGVKSAELVVEAATENIDLKLKIFKDIDAHAPARAILATNTSSISITRIAAVTGRPGQVIGMHFMNPVPVMKLVEVIRGYNTSDTVTKTVMELSTAIGKSPVEVNDYAGFVANRVLMPMINEAIETLFQGVGGVAEIDTVMKLGMAHPMGPLQLADFIGLDTCLAILRVLQEGFGNPKYAPCPLLVQMVTAGKMGVKSGEGFYVYTAGSKDLVVSPRIRTGMIREAGTGDIPIIRTIAHETWPHAYFPAILSAEQLDYMLGLLYSEAALAEAMTKKQQRFFLLEQEGTTVGFASCTPHHGRSTVTHLNKLYVRPAVQGTGAGQDLLEHVLRYASAEGDKVIELNVNKRNPAIGFYEHLGFRIVREEVIDIGHGYVMDDYVMARALAMEAERKAG